MIGKGIYCNDLADVPSDLIIIGWAFMSSIYCLLEANIFLNSEQLIYKSKAEKKNVSLDIFVSDTSIARNLHLPGRIGGKTF